jgi:hypothetical protein
MSVVKGFTFYKHMKISCLMSWRVNSIHSVHSLGQKNLPHSITVACSLSLNAQRVVQLITWLSASGHYHLIESDYHLIECKWALSPDWAQVGIGAATEECLLSAWSAESVCRLAKCVPIYVKYCACRSQPARNAQPHHTHFPLGRTHISISLRPSP